MTITYVLLVAAFIHCLTLSQQKGILRTDAINMIKNVLFFEKGKPREIITDVPPVVGPKKGLFRLGVHSLLL